MGRKPKDIAARDLEALPGVSADNALTAEIASLCADVRAIAAYIADRDQLRSGSYGERIVEIAREQ